jgi:hypothetical protein
VVTTIAPLLVAFAVYAAVLHVIDPTPTGDEPHYLLVAQSIAYDGDVALSNDYASRSRTLRAVGFFPLDPHLHAGVYTSSGELRPTHGVGLSALIAPAVALSGVTAVHYLMVLIAALFAQQLYLLLRDLGFQRRFRIPAWIAAVFCLPVLAFSSQIYPELPGALLLVIALRVIVTRASSPVALALGSAAGAALVWLHVRYLPLSVGVFLGLAYASTAGGPPKTDEESGSPPVPFATAVGRCLRTARKHWRTVTVPLVAPYAVSFVLFAVEFQRWYGSPSPGAAYALFYSNTFGSSGWGFLYEYALSDLLQPPQGWIPYVPVHWLGLAALGCLIIRFGWAAAAGLAVVVGYELALASADLSIGWAYPARYIIIVIPLVAIPLAVALQHVRAARILFVPLLAASLVFAVAAVRHPLALYPIAAKPRLFGIEQVAGAFPSPRDLGFPTSFVVSPGQVAPQTGVVQADRVVATASHDQPGYVLFGPYAPLKSGPYRATFTLAATGTAGKTPVATIDVSGGPPSYTTFAQRVVTADQLESHAGSRITLPFTTPGGYLTETRVYYHGNGTLRVGSVEVARDPNAAVPARRVADWQLALLWIAATMLVGWLFVKTMRPVTADCE